MKKIWIGIGIIIVVLVIAFIITQTKPEPDEIKIGAILPLKGEDAKLGESSRNGINLAL